MNATETGATPSLSRSLWRQTLLEATKEPGRLIWLFGPRGVGKTTIVKGLKADALYIDCESFAGRKLAASAEFFKEDTSRTVILDEVQAVTNNVELVVAALQQPRRQVVVVSSSLASPPSQLNSRLMERQIMTPLRMDELPGVDGNLFLRRLHQGGLPAAFFSERFPAEYYAQWLDSFLIRDFLPQLTCNMVRELYALVLRLFRGSGVDSSLSELARDIGVKRGAPDGWVLALKDIGAVTEVTRFGRTSNRNAQSRRFYACDTGLVCWANGWHEVANTDPERLWKHVVLAQLQSYVPHACIAYFADGDEQLDFVMDSQAGIDAFDCRWDPVEYTPSAFDTFRSSFPHGRNFLVCPRQAEDFFSRGGHRIEVRSPADFVPVITERVSASEIRFLTSPVAKEQKEAQPPPRNTTESKGDASAWSQGPVPGVKPPVATQEGATCSSDQAGKIGVSPGQHQVCGVGKTSILVQEDDWEQCLNAAEDSEVNSKWNGRCRLDLSNLPQLTAEQQIEWARKYRQALGDLCEMIDALPEKDRLLEKSFPEIKPESRSLPMMSQDLPPGRVAEALALAEGSSTAPPLDPIATLATRAVNIRNKLVECNLRLVIMLAGRYKSQGNLDDLINEGTTGLIKGINRFDPDRGCKPSDYLARWIKGSILTELASQGFIFKFHWSILALSQKIKEKQTSAKDEGKPLLEVDELAQALDTSVENILAALLVQPAVSLDQPLVNGDESTPLSDRIPAPETVPPYEEEEFQTAFRELLAHLAPREQRILRLMYRLEGFSEAVDQYGIKLKVRCAPGGVIDHEFIAGRRPTAKIKII